VIERGCIILSKENKENIAIIQDPNQGKKDIFIFPKGHLNLNETPELCAIREIEEETGLKIKLIKKLDTINYISDFDSNDKYKLTFYLAKSLDDTIKYDKKIEHHIILHWVSYKDVKAKLTFNQLKRFYERNFKKIEEYIKR
jgi:8-oxo-dGTP pyrophosphatase MutT (NUDIX family)